jgi:hypothetical protein
MRPGWIVLLLLLAAAPVRSELDRIEGVVAEVQLLDVAGLSDERFLILSLVDGGSYLLPGVTRLAAAAGVKVSVRYRSPRVPDELPVACSVTVLGMPILVAGEEVLRPASRPFVVYANEQASCD